MENINFMQEFYKILLDAIRKQGFSVILLVGASYIMLGEIKAQKAEITSHFNQEIDELRAMYQNCDNERRNLSLELADLKNRLAESAFKHKK